MQSVPCPSSQHCGECTSPWLRLELSGCRPWIHPGPASSTSKEYTVFLLYSLLAQLRPCPTVAQYSTNPVVVSFSHLLDTQVENYKDKVITMSQTIQNECKLHIQYTKDHIMKLPWPYYRFLYRKCNRKIVENTWVKTLARKLPIFL